MKTMQQWFDEYAISHQNKINQKIHFICVPVIYFSIIGMFMSIPTIFLKNTLQINNPFIENWAFFALLLLLLFYLKLSFNVFVKMMVFSMLCIVGNYFIGQHFNLLHVSLLLFITAWIGQFYGHKVEGKKPSFFKDLQFLLIGPPWIFEKFTTKKHY